MLKKYQSDIIIYLLVQHVKYSCIVFSTVLFFCRLFEALSWAPAGGGGKSRCYVPPPPWKIKKKLVLLFGGLFATFTLCGGPFRYFFLCVFVRACPPPLRKLLRAPMSIIT